MKNAIVALTRGYSEEEKYSNLIERNRCIRAFFGDKYPLILFHEGNITKHHQDYINSKDAFGNIQFWDISLVWSGGYEGMCRFNSYDLWEVCKDFDYILRVDEDCNLLSIGQDPFGMIGDNVYLKSVYWDESHSETNATLPAKVESLTGVKPEVFYNRKYPYTNVSLSSVKFWRQETINGILKEIATCEDQRINRWGDLPVLGSLLNVFAVGRVGTLTGLSYSHISHNNVIISE